METPKRLLGMLVCHTAFFGLIGSAFAGLKPFPLSAGQRGTVTCLENPAVTYDIYLPPGYSTNGTPLPILYTFSASGGGMVSTFQTVCASLNIITVGVISSKNSVPWNTILRDFYAVPRDIRQRVRFDPTAVFASGLSGGGESCYIFSRFWSQHVAGILPMAGWLGRQNTSLTSVPYYSTDRVQTNLLVARTSGTTDTGLSLYNQFDGTFLAACGAVVNDWYFTGGHTSAPDAVKTSCLQWLLSQRIPAMPGDETNSVAQAGACRSRIAAGESEAVLRECVATLMGRPRTWFALQAQLVMDDLMTNYNSFRSLNVSNLYPASGDLNLNATGLIVTSGDVYDSVNKTVIYNFTGVGYWSQSDFAADLFYYYARGAATNSDWQRHACALKALTGISGVNGDRAGDDYYLLTKFGHVAPVVQLSPARPPNPLNLRLSKDAPDLTYSIQVRSNLTSDVWQNASPVPSETDTSWSATVDFDPESEGEFYRVATSPLPGMSPPWPDDGGKGQ